MTRLARRNKSKRINLWKRRGFKIVGRIGFVVPRLRDLPPLSRESWIDIDRLVFATCRAMRILDQAKVS